MHRYQLLVVTLFITSLVAVGCGWVGDETGLSPASDYRRLQLERALEGVSIVDGLIVAETASVLPLETV